MVLLTHAVSRECGVIRAGRCVRRSRIGGRSQRALLQGFRPGAGRGPARRGRCWACPPKAERRSARAAPSRCS